MTFKTKINNRWIRTARLFLAGALLATAMPASAAGKTKSYVIWYGVHSTRTERAVCEDLKADLEKVTGATVTVAEEPAGIKGTDYYFLVGTPKSSRLLARWAAKGLVQLKNSGAGTQGGIIKLVKAEAAPVVLLAGATEEGMQNTVYAYCRSVLGIDPLAYWTGYRPDRKEDFNPYNLREQVIPSPAVPIICYMENDVDELANMHKPYLEYDMATWKGMVNSLRRIRYNAIQLFDMLGRPEFFIREPYKKLRPGYRVNLPLVDSMIAYAHLKGMKIQVDLSLGYQMRSISDSMALCWSRYKDEWIKTWVYYLTETPLGKADIYSLRPRNQVWDRAYVSSCGEDKIKVFNEVFAVLDSLLSVYRPGAARICVCYDDAMEMFNEGFTPPRDFIIAWSDDGYCNFKDMPSGTRGYRFGTYMHAGYWTNHTVHDPYPPKIDSVMTSMLKNYNARSYLEVNGQTFRPFLLNLEAFGEWAYDPYHFDGATFYRQWTSRYFGPEASPFAMASMQYLHAAQFDRTGYVRMLAGIRTMIGYLADRQVATPRGSFRAAYGDIRAPELEKRYFELGLALDSAAAGMRLADDQAGFYYDYVYLPALMFRQLLAFESTLLEASRRKHAYEVAHRQRDLAEAKELVKKSAAQLEKIRKTCLEGDRNPAWKTWYDPVKRRPNNGFPAPGMIRAIRENLDKL